MRLAISHQTLYHYTTPPSATVQTLRLTPRNNPRQQILQWFVRSNGQMTDNLTDGYGNLNQTLALYQPPATIEITVNGVVETLDQAVLPAEALSPVIFLRETPLTQADAHLRDFAQTLGGEKKVSLRTLYALMEAVAEKVVYTPHVTHVNTTAAQAFALQAGVCQDHAHVLLSCCRVLGIPARYVSGYLYSEGHWGAQMASHAWVEVWHSGAWHGLDASNCQRVNGSYLRLASGLDYQDACPIRGWRNGGTGEALEVHVAVQRLH